MQKTRPIGLIVSLWLAWFAILFLFQAVVSERMPPQRPDFSREWTPEFTRPGSLRGRIYLNEPFMNRQVAYDSEYYLSISIGGYDDPNVGTTTLRNGQTLSLNYAFFPLYPAIMSVLRLPFEAAGMTPIGAATLAGMLISLVGTLVGMVSLYSLARDRLEESGGFRAAFYLLVFPSSFFLATVYTEGLFIGLAFTALLMMKRRQLLLAGILAALATLTRAVGLALIVPLALAWLAQIDWIAFRQNPGATLRPRLSRLLPGLVGVLLPIGAHLLWRSLYGQQFDLVEQTYFGRGLMNMEMALGGWEQAFKVIAEGDNLQMRIYYLLELGAVLLALVACLFTLRRYPGIALFGLLALVISFFSGSPQSLIRYVMVLPSLYLMLAQLGRNWAFDRAWTLLSVLLLGFLVYLFAFDLWVA
jgi:hypothetical protein